MTYRDMLSPEKQQYDFGHRSQTTQIFQKTLQLPPRLPGLNSSGVLQPGSIQKQAEAGLGMSSVILPKTNG